MCVVVGNELFIASSFARFARLATSPSFACVSNLAPDSSLCRAAAPRFASASAAVPQLRPFQLLHSDCVRCSPLTATSSLRLLPDCVRFGCCSPIAIASTAAPRLRPLQLLLPDRFRFDCCSLPSACSPSCSGRFQAQCSRTFFAEFEVQV